MKLILGSQSPRRRELLAGLDIPFEAVTIDADESYPPELQGGDIALYIARAKARAYANKLKVEDVLITSDTIVWCDGQMLGKPCGREDAVRMLRLLSGKTHQVFTGVYLTYSPSALPSREEVGFCVRTDVTFKVLTDDEIAYYVDTYKPYDKAGAYGIQEWIGYIGCEKLEGSYFNVMGFPVQKVYQELKKLGF